MCVRRHGAAVSAAAEYQERMLLVASSEGDEPGGCSVNNSTERRSVALSSDSEDCTGRVLGRKVISKIRSEPQSSVHTGRRYAKVLIAPPHTPPPSSPISKSGRGRGKDFSAKSGKANGRKRKRRSLNGTSGGSSVEPDILICFDSSAVGIRRFSLKKKALDDNVQQVEVFTPSFRPILVFPPVMPNFCRVIADSRASSPSANSSHVSDTGGGYSFIDDEEFHLIEEDVMSRRHLRYESVEKTMRLCRPEVLKSLQTSAAIDLGVSESDSGTDIPTKPLVEALNVPSKFSLDESPKCAAPMHPKVVTMAAPNSTHTLVP